MDLTRPRSSRAARASRPARQPRPPRRRRRVGRPAALTAALAALAVGAPAALPSSAAWGGGGGGGGRSTSPVLVARAVLPAVTLVEGPQSGLAVPDANGVDFPLPSQPVIGFSAVIDGRHRGELLAMPDNGFGSKANSADFLIRAYYVRPDWKTARGGPGTVEVGADPIQFRDPLGKFPFTIVQEGTAERLFTGADIDPESLQRDHRGHLWVGDEFGPWILHFSPTGVLLDPPFSIPGVVSPSNPALGTGTATHPGSRGFEAMSISADGRKLFAAFEGASVADPDPHLRRILEFDIRDEALTGREWIYRTEAPGNMIADMDRLGGRTMAVIERDAGRGETALFRSVYAIRLGRPSTEPVTKRLLVDLTAIPDPALISLPAINDGDVGLGDPFSVVCESVEVVHVLRHGRLLIGCDNNLPNTGRNPLVADDTELIVVDLHGRGAPRV